MKDIIIDISSLQVSMRGSALRESKALGEVESNRFLQTIPGERTLQDMSWGCYVMA